MPPRCWADAAARQLGWREKLYFGESKERQDRRREKLEEIDTISKAIIAHWHEFNRLHTQVSPPPPPTHGGESNLSIQPLIQPSIQPSV
jgi:hypothetical protein